MHTYKISYKDQFTNGKWSSTTYSSPEEVSNKFLIEFFGLHECEEYKIEKIK